jgi:hypothetical protein
MVVVKHFLRLVADLEHGLNCEHGVLAAQCFSAQHDPINTVQHSIGYICCLSSASSEPNITKCDSTKLLRDKGAAAAAKGLLIANQQRISGSVAPINIAL